ncbi:DUF1190 domain-containing protein [Photobacterium kishitanii]|uniref:DUF1190 domain-containing protein n=1 Tax=Photobacterium kishitanii TaxID=318456 RepID=A0A0B7JF73_9GAMM|nr:DUF1190 domain-containing protein [Photobacterium kishitanii]OBU25442.1 hypothetical protein AYY22_04730 [Photobacterium kishitanii]PSU86761.1 DUF1190 domain-containing protein [Photobacterium kishitanii]PSU88479.1 DUF1190 domain-containing protein [Photobacterium kishitanii]PSU95548.1 DUF1190 domain-containing protein [Photobacterium kishitanii]PSV14282.1 DUF1190 domain-containing protein [Photobacterium kishitanii]
MKRSSNIHRNQMRKSYQYQNWAPITIVALGATIVLAGCKDNETLAQTQYDSLQDCINADSSNPKQVEMCATAYQQAVDAAPKFDSESDCQSSGTDNCRQIQGSNNTSYWVPALAGFIVGRMMDNGRQYSSQPIYYPSSKRNSDMGQWTQGRYKESTSQNYKSKYKNEKPAVSRTISRGGFGSKASAKSSWGGSRGWGG